MSGRRTIAGLLLLCALALCAFAAPSASAAGTTAFTCAPAEKGAGFEDTHCDKAVESGAKYKHEAISPGKSTEITLTNQKTKNATTEHTPSTLHGLLLGIKTNVTCTKVHGTGTLTNEEVKGVMRTAGTATIEHTECTVTEPSGCTVKEPIVYSTKFESYEKGEEMGLLFTPKEGKAFGAITYNSKEGQKCGIKGTFGIEGSFEGTPGSSPTGKGTTLGFTEGMSENLHWGTAQYTLTGVLNWEMKEATPTTGNQIALTTT